MKLCLVLVGGLLLLGCAREPTEEAVELPADTAGSGPTISLADIAGTWNVRYVPESGDASAVTNSQIEITGEAWTLHLADRDPVEGDVTVSGDSILVVEGPYESVRRDGTMVTTHSVYGWKGTGCWAPWSLGIPRAPPIRFSFSEARERGLPDVGSRLRGLLMIGDAL